MMSKKKSDGTRSCIDSTYDKCMYGALIRHMKANTPSENGCTVPWVMEDGEIPFITGTKNICTLPYNINQSYWQAWTRVTNQKNDCPLPCKTLLLSLGAKNYKVSHSTLVSLVLSYLIFFSVWWRTDCWQIVSVFCPKDNVLWGIDPIYSIVIICRNWWICGASLGSFLVELRSLDQWHAWGQS